jgi:hypothetical protein
MATEHFIRCLQEKGHAMRRLTAVCLSGLVLVIFSISAGCITTREGQLPPRIQWPPEAKSVKPLISLVVSGKAFVNGKEQDVPATVLVHQWRALTVRAYQDSGLFSDVKPEVADTELRAEIVITDQGESNRAMAFVTGFTMFLIPSSSTDVITVSTTLKDHKGTTIDTFQKQETSTLWMQLFLGFAMPFRSKEAPLVYDLNRATILEARAKGYL